MAKRNRLQILLVTSAVYTAANAFVHADQWQKGYRHIPSSVAGSWVVRLGFPAAALTAALLAVALLSATRFRRLAAPVVVATAAFHLSSLAVLIATRVGSVFGWSEPSWTLGANQARATEVGALMVLGLAAIAIRQTATLRAAVPLRVAKPALDS